MDAIQERKNIYNAYKGSVDQIIDQTKNISVHAWWDYYQEHVAIGYPCHIARHEVANPCINKPGGSVSMRALFKSVGQEPRIITTVLCPDDAGYWYELGPKRTSNFADCILIP